MIYTDSEIYHKYITGVKPSILADLNGCTIREIKSIISIKHDEQAKRDRDYQQIFKIAKQRRYEVDMSLKSQETQSKPKSKHSRFTYSLDQLNIMRTGLEKGLSGKEIYEKLFHDAENKPGYGSFMSHLKEFRIYKSQVSSKTHEDTQLTEELIKRLNKDKQKYQEDLDKLYADMKSILIEITKIDLTLDKLTDSRNKY